MHLRCRSLLVVLAVFAFALPLPSLAAPPTRDEKVAAITTDVRTWQAHPPGSPMAKAMALAVSMLVHEAAGAKDPSKPTPEDHKQIAEVVNALKAKGADVGPAINEILGDFKSFECRSKQNEAKGNLKALYVAEESYRAEYDVYLKDQKALGFEARGTTLRYKYEVVEVKPEKFKARAVGIGDMAGDEWTINEMNVLENTKNLCAK